MWGEHAVGKLVKGNDIMSPEIAVFVDDEAGDAVADKVRKRLGHFIDRKITAAFEHLIAMRDDEALPGLAKGVAFRLAESLGVIPRSAIANDIKALDQDQRGTLRKHGIRFGQYTIFHHLMLKPAPTRLRLVLWSLQEGLGEFPEAPPAGLVTVPAVIDAPKGYYPRAGYRLAGERAIRIDMLERLADMIRSFDVKGGFEANPDMLSITGMTLEQFAELMQGLGYAAEKGEREKVKPAVEAKPDAEADAVESKEDTTATEEPKEVTENPKSEGVEEDTTEVFYTFKWVPKTRPAVRPQTQKTKPRFDKNKGKGKPTGAKNHSASPARKEKAIDPDNPFAALMALKNKS
jgi:ATP-dependent RNA helicase SUPV3L1/SUV3